MKRLKSSVRSAKPPLQKRRETLKAIHLGSAIKVPFGVIHNIVGEVIAHLVVADCIIRVNLSPVLFVLEQDVLQGFTGRVWDDLRARHGTISVQYPSYYSISAVHSASLDKAKFAVFVHVLGKVPARSVGFYFRIRPTGFVAERVSAKRMPVKSSSNVPDHEPCKPVRAKCLVNPYPENSAHQVDQDPASRPGLKRELPISAVKPKSSHSDEIVLVGTASWTEDFTVGATDLHGVLDRPLRIGEMDDSSI